MPIRHGILLACLLYHAIIIITYIGCLHTLHGNTTAGALFSAHTYQHATLLLFARFYSAAVTVIYATHHHLFSFEAPVYIHIYGLLIVGITIPHAMVIAFHCILSLRRWYG